MVVGKTLYKSLYWKMIQFISSFLVNIVFARALQSVASAELYSLVYLLSLCISFFTLGLDIGLNYYFSRNRISPGQTSRLILFIVALALLVCLPLLRTFYPSSRYPDVNPNQLLLFAAFGISGGLLINLSGTLFSANSQNHLTGKLAFVLNIALAILTLIVSRYVTVTAVVGYLFRLYFLFSFLQGLFLFLLACWLYRDRDSGRRAGTDSPPIPVADIFRFSFTAFVINFIFFTGARLFLYLLPDRVPAADLGNYIQVYKIVEYLGVAVSAVYYPFIALVAGNDKEEMKEKVLLLVRISNTLVFFVGLFVLATGGWLFPLIFGRSFDRMYQLFIGFLPGLFAVCSSTFFTAYYFGSGRLKVNLISACLQFCGMLLFFVLFGKGASVTGAAWAFTVGVSLSLGYDILIFRSVFRYGLRDLLWVRSGDLGKIYGLMRKP